eukprot:Skav232410  [mRNA]  locus=scaffold4273:11885:19846:+ [translate_table: standard]
MVFEASDGQTQPIVDAIRTCDYLELENTLQDPIACVHADWSHKLLKRKKLEVGTLCEGPLLFDSGNADGARTWTAAAKKIVVAFRGEEDRFSEPYRLVREAAEGAREVLETNDAFYHQEYKELSRRIVGFGNYEPPEADTKLPDGSVNVAKDVTFGDVLGTAVGGVLNGAGAIIEGVKGLFETHSRHVSGLELEGMDMDEPASVEDPYEARERKDSEED